jgi:hypothetical protein
MSYYIQHVNNVVRYDVSRHYFFLDYHSMSEMHAEVINLQRSPDSINLDTIEIFMLMSTDTVKSFNVLFLFQNCLTDKVRACTCFRLITKQKSCKLQDTIVNLPMIHFIFSLFTMVGCIFNFFW